MTEFQLKERLHSVKCIDIAYRQIQSSPQSRFAIHGCYNNANFGDILILDVMSYYAEKYTGFSPFCPWVRRVNAPFLKADVGRGWRDVVSLDAAFFGGGGYFCNDYSHSLNYSLPARLWGSQRVPYVIVGVGVGPYMTPAAAGQFRFICEGAQAICVRDEESKDLLEQIGVDSDRIEVTADAVLSLTLDMIPQRSLIKARSLLSKLKNKKLLLGIQWGSAGSRTYTTSPPFIARNPHPSFKELIMQLKKGLKGHESDVGLVWVLNYNWSSSEAIRKLAKENFPDSIFVRTRDHWVLTSILSMLDGVFTTMLHVGITAWVLGTAPCAWASHGKTERFYRQIGREDFVTTLGKSKNKLSDWFRAFVESPKDYSIEALGARERLRNLSYRNYQVLTDHLKPILTRNSRIKN